jgi:hypothetical protein
MKTKRFPFFEKQYKKDEELFSKKSRRKQNYLASIKKRGSLVYSLEGRLSPHHHPDTNDPGR